MMSGRLHGETAYEPRRRAKTMRSITNVAASLVAFVAFVNLSLAQVQQPGTSNQGGSAPGATAPADLNLVGTLEGRRIWTRASNRDEVSGVAKLEHVRIENGTGTALFTGGAGPGRRTQCDSIYDVPAVLTLDSSGVLTITAKSDDCGTWAYILKRVSPTRFEGQHRVNPTRIELDFTPAR